MGLFGNNAQPVPKEMLHYVIKQMGEVYDFAVKYSYLEPGMIQVIAAPHEGGLKRSSTVFYMINFNFNSESAVSAGLDAINDCTNLTWSRTEGSAFEAKENLPWAVDSKRFKTALVEELKIQHPSWILNKNLGGVMLTNLW